MVGVGKSVLYDLPGIFPIHPVIVKQNPHQFRNRQYRVGIIQLDTIVFREITQVITVMVDVVLYHVLQRGRYKEVLLTYPQHFAFESSVIGVQNPAQVSHPFPLNNRIGKPLRIESLIVELFHRF